MSKKKKHYGKGLLPLPVIRAASNGDPDALQVILKHYEGYILALASVRLYSEDGVYHIHVNEALRREVELRLIVKTLGFRFKLAA